MWDVQTTCLALYTDKTSPVVRAMVLLDVALQAPLGTWSYDTATRRASFHHLTWKVIPLHSTIYYRATLVRPSSSAEVDLTRATTLALYPQPWIGLWDAQQQLQHIVRCPMPLAGRITRPLVINHVEWRLDARAQALVPTTAGALWYREDQGGECVAANGPQRYTLLQACVAQSLQQRAEYRHNVPFMMKIQSVVPGHLLFDFYVREEILVLPESFPPATCLVDPVMDVHWSPRTFFSTPVSTLVIGRNVVSGHLTPRQLLEMDVAPGHYSHIILQDAQMLMDVSEPSRDALLHRIRLLCPKHITCWATAAPSVWVLRALRRLGSLSRVHKHFQPRTLPRRETLLVTMKRREPNLAKEVRACIPSLLEHAKSFPAGTAVAIFCGREEIMTEVARSWPRDHRPIIHLSTKDDDPYDKWSRWSKSAGVLLYNHHHAALLVDADPDRSVVLYELHPFSQLVSYRPTTLHVDFSINAEQPSHRYRWQKERKSQEMKARQFFL